MHQVPVGSTAVVDPDRVRHMLSILVGNAFQHAGTAAVIEIRADRRADGIELVVADDGPGVPTDVRDSIFAPFTHGTDDDHDPGAGLGLYIVAELAALHGGRTWVDDRPGGGSQFHLWLPRPRGTLQAPNASSGDQREASVLSPRGRGVVEPLLGHQLAEEGFIDRTAIAAADRITDVLTRPGALHPPSSSRSST